jgi:hypothetical protein
MPRSTVYRFVVIVILLVGAAAPAMAGDAVTVNIGADLFNRYVWRGLDIASTPSIQPALSVGMAGFELGAWGAYTLSNQESASDEVDFYLNYTYGLENGVSVAPIVTDYYFPNAGRRMFNFNDYDAVANDSIPDPGAHTLELGLSITGPEAFPVTLSAYVNVYNDAGNNTYFELDYRVTVNGTDVTFLCGAAGGSTKNPGYYGTDDLQVINIGVTASRPLGLSEKFSLPLTVGFILNPNAEVSNLLVGLSF